MKNNLKNTHLEDEKFMRLALEQAENAMGQGEVPVGAVLVGDGKIIYRGHNQTELLNDVTAHAEIICISSAGGIFTNKVFPKLHFVYYS